MHSSLNTPRAGQQPRLRASTLMYAVIVVLLVLSAFISSRQQHHPSGAPLLARFRLASTSRAASSSPSAAPAAVSPLAFDCNTSVALAARHSWKNVIVSEGGRTQLTMWAYNASDIVSDHVSRGGWELHEIQQIEWALGRYRHAIVARASPAPIFVDVGANIGWFTLTLALRNYSVHAFEAMAQNAHMIAASLCANPRLAPRVTLFHTGLGAAPARCWIISGTTNAGDGNTMCGLPDEAAARARVPPDYLLRGDINISRLDDILLPRLYPASPRARRPAEPPTASSPRSPPPLVMKIDVEGFEYDVMSGATALLARGAFHYILSEWSPVMMGGPARAVDFLHFMTRHGFAASLRGFAGPFLPVERLNDLADLWQHQQRNLYLVHHSAPTFGDADFLMPAQAGLPDRSMGAGAGVGSQGAGGDGVAGPQQPHQGGGARHRGVPWQGDAIIRKQIRMRWGMEKAGGRAGQTQMDRPAGQG